MPTTITVSEPTRKRLASYKMGEATFDDVLNTLMDRVALEDIAADQIVEHHKRLKENKWVSGSEFQDYLRRRLKARARRGRT